jgi:Ni2+-binding GTPase involved in maturation of urease and hydrogenase
MKFITVSGPPSSGKTSVLINVIKALTGQKKRVGVVKFDCLSTYDNRAYQELGVSVKVGLSGNLCPDHYFVSNIEDCFEWGQSESLDYLLSESAGLCNRCSPHITNVLAICVIDNLMGINTPKKIGPMLRFADIVIITKGDIVSQAEREVFSFRVRQVNTKATIMFINGITGQGAYELTSLITKTEPIEKVSGEKLRFPMPAALCSYCLGEKRIGEDYQVGNMRKIKVY